MATASSATIYPGRGYTIGPRVPRGLTAAVEGLAREVLRHRPQDIYLFAAHHFEELVKLREEYATEHEWIFSRDRIVAEEVPSEVASGRLGKTRTSKRSRPNGGNKVVPSSTKSGWSIDRTAKVLRRHGGQVGNLVGKSRAETRAQRSGESTTRRKTPPVMGREGESVEYPRGRSSSLVHATDHPADKRKTQSLEEISIFLPACAARPSSCKYPTSRGRDDLTLPPIGNEASKSVERVDVVTLPALSSTNRTWQRSETTRLASGGQSNEKEIVIESEQHREPLEEIFKDSLNVTPDSLEPQEVDYQTRDENDSAESRANELKTKLIEIETVEKSIERALAARSPVEASNGVDEEEKEVEEDEAPRTDTVQETLSASTEDRPVDRATREQEDESRVPSENPGIDPPVEDDRSSIVSPQIQDITSYVLTEGSPCEIPESVITVVIPERRVVEPFGEYVRPISMEYSSCQDIDFPSVVKNAFDLTIARQDLDKIKEEVEDEEEEKSNEERSLNDIPEKEEEGEEEVPESKGKKSAESSNRSNEKSRESSESLNETKETSSHESLPLDVDRPYVPELNLDSLRDLTISSFKTSDFIEDRVPANGKLSSRETDSIYSFPPSETGGWREDSSRVEEEIARELIENLTERRATVEDLEEDKEDTEDKEDKENKEDKETKKEEEPTVQGILEEESERVSASAAESAPRLEHTGEFHDHLPLSLLEITPPYPTMMETSEKRRISPPLAIFCAINLSNPAESTSLSSTATFPPTGYVQFVPYIVPEASKEPNATIPPARLDDPREPLALPETPKPLLIEELPNEGEEGDRPDLPKQSRRPSMDE